MQKLDITPNQSKLFITLLIVLLSGSAAILFYLPFPAWLKALMAVVTLFYTAFIFNRQGRLQRLRQDDHGWHLTLQQQAFSNLALRGDSTISSLVSILRFDLPGKPVTYSCVLFKDAMNKQVYRQLRVRIRNTKVTSFLATSVEIR